MKVTLNENKCNKIFLKDSQPNVEEKLQYGWQLWVLICQYLAFNIGQGDYYL